jgi:glycosyl transferase family 25
MKAYLINLGRAQHRLETSRQTLERAGIEMVRVEAIDGLTLEKPYKDYSRVLYRLFHGKKTIPSELGCYFSHLKAMRQFLESEDDYALILEDDIGAGADSKVIIKAAMKYGKFWDILRLSGLRNGHPWKIAELKEGCHLCVNMTRQTGAGAYVVNRKAAARILRMMKTMKVPYDHAFDREWFYGLKALCVSPFPFDQRAFEHGSQIDASKLYSNPKYPAWQRYWSVFPYRFVNELSRFIFRFTQYLVTKSILFFRK